MGTASHNTRALAFAVVTTVIAIGPVAGQQRPTFRAGIDTVSVYATVRASDGRLVPDLSQEEFEIRDEGKVRDITVFSREIVPITFVLLLDMSGSRENKVEWMRDSARAFVDAMLPIDRGKIGTFGDEVAISPRLTGDRSYLRRVIDEEIWPGGATPLWESIDAGMSALQGTEGRRVILVVTDGYDSTGGKSTIMSTTRGAPVRMTGPLPTVLGGRYYGSRIQIGIDDVLARARKEDFMIYAVAIGQATTPTGTPLGDGPLHLDMQLATVETGGGFHMFERSADAIDSMTQVAAELHHQYLLGFQPLVADGKTHKLEIKVKKFGMKAQARRSYVAKGGDK